MFYGSLTYVRTYVRVSVCVQPMTNRERTFLKNQLAIFPQQQQPHQSQWQSEPKANESTDQSVRFNKVVTPHHTTPQ